MSSGQNQKSNIDQSLSFEDVSKLFPLPLSEAADILGVSSSVLKKLCNENGLERWPHRKYLAGKSVEEIKKEALKEKSKALGGPSQKNIVATTSAATASPGSLVKDKSPRSAPEMSKSQGNAQQSGSKTMSTLQSQHMLASGLAIETNMDLDEFKYGFPSTGLSECTYRWWGGNSDDNDGVSKDGTENSSEVNDASKVQTDDRLASVCEEKTDSMAEDSGSDKQSEVSLSAVRKRAVEEGQKALKLRVLKKYGADKLGNEEKILMRRLYQTS